MASTGIKHLHLNRRSYVVRLRVPVGLRDLPQFKSGFVQEYLQTTDRDEAKRRMHAALARLQAIFDRAREGGQITPDELHYEKLADGRRIYDTIAMDPINLPRVLRIILSGFTEEAPGTGTIAYRQQQAAREEAIERLKEKGIEPTEASIKDLCDTWVEGLKMALMIWDHKAPFPQLPPRPSRPGSMVPLAQHVDEWLASAGVKGKTKDKRRATVRKFSETFATPADVTRPKVQEWLNRLARDKAPGTVRRMLSEARLYWEHLRTMQIVAEEHRPFEGVKVPKRKANGEKAPKRQPFEPADVVRILDAAKDDRQLAALVSIMMYSGARPEELCSLRVSDVNLKDGSFMIRDSKTDAGERRVPIHSQLLPLIYELADPKHDYIIDGLKADADGDRSHNLIQRAGRLIRKMGFGREHVLYSIRKTVAQLFKAARVEEYIAADIMGHEIETMTYGLYAGDVALTVKRDAIEKLAYPEPTREAK